MSILDERMKDQLNRLSDLPVAFIECIDNLDGIMTNPRLFRKYVLPAYQEYSQIAHTQSKKLGSHTDGDLRSLTSLLVESGLDVCEFFTPAPITSCTFEEAWAAWEHGPMIWGGIPSYYLEEGVPETEFHAFIDRILAFASQRPIILGIGDAVMAENDIDRLAWIAGRVAETPVDWPR